MSKYVTSHFGNEACLKSYSSFVTFYLEIFSLFVNPISHKI